MTDIVDELEWRGLIAQHTDLDALRAHLSAGPVTFYCGFDPTAASLHHGHLVQLMLMRHLQVAGHHPIALVGGATGLIGDPRSKGERSLKSKETVAGYVDGLRHQIGQFLDFEGPNAAVMVNNLDWTQAMSTIDFLRDLGKHFRVGTMLNKDIVKRRLESDEGISFTEFSYQILQANDYLELHHRYGVTLETGGNDQWGNMIGGVDLIRKIDGDETHVMTTPIITKSDGTKFGKSEGGAIWLDPTMMSPYAFYQFWLKTEDADVERMLKVFTLLPREEIEQIVAEHAQAPHLHVAQQRLAQAVTTLVHGEAAVSQVEQATQALWGGGDLVSLDQATLESATADLPRGVIQVGTSTIVDALVASGLEKGRSAARRTVAGGGAYLNNQKVEDEDAPITAEQLLAGGFALVRKGRRNLAVVRSES